MPGAPSPWSAAGAAAGASFDQPTITPEPSTPSRPKRSRVVVGAAVAGVLAVGAAGVFAVANFTGGTAGGAATPDELGLELLSALENEDLLGAMDTFLPGERAVIQEPLVEMVSELSRLEVLSSDADLADLGGYEIDLERESVTVAGTNVEDIANVRLFADATISIDGSQVPIGALITDNLGGDELDELRSTTETTTDQLDVKLTAVQEDGRWYFSAFYSLAEALRSEAPGTAIPVDGIGAVGGDTPEAAVDLMLDQLAGLDVRGMIQILNPGEAGALQRYAPLFVDDAEAALAEVPVTLSITDRQFRVVGDGDTRTVLFDAVTVSGEAEGTTFSFATDGDCVTIELDGESQRECVSDSEAAMDDFMETLGTDLPETRALVETVQQAFADLEPIGVELREHDGQWYLSPMTTWTEAVLKMMKALDRGEIDAIVDQVEVAGDELQNTSEDVFGGLLEAIYGPGFLDDSSISVFDEGSDDMFGDLIDDSFDNSFDDSFDSSFDDPFGDATGDDDYDCWLETDPAVATSCFDEAVVAGTMSPLDVPVVLRHPECGYTQGWGSAANALPDDEFIAGAAAARECFLQLVVTGDASEWELPYEITHLECFEGRNWYNVFDDPDYDERFWECVSEPVDLTAVGGSDESSSTGPSDDASEITIVTIAPGG